MQRRSQIAKYLAGVLTPLAGMVALLEWLGVTPKSFKNLMTLTFPHFVWLVVAIFLFAFSLRDSFFRVRVATNIKDVFTFLPLFAHKRTRLTIRVTQGFVCDRRYDLLAHVILLNVRVDGPPATVKDWKLDLKHGDNHWKTAYVQAIKKGETDYSAPPDNRAVAYVKAITPHVPDHGWLLFTVSDIGPESCDHVFGATFVLTAVEDNGKESSLAKPPGEWLHRASRINYPQ